MSKKIKIEIECSAKCGNPLLIQKASYNMQKSYGKKEWYHRECVPMEMKKITIPKMTGQKYYRPDW